jgi:5-methylphenazine-1-carboxylate 1-monooxygenase
MPEVGIHRGKLHKILFDATVKRLGQNRVHTNHRCTGVTQSEQGATVHFVQGTGGASLPSVQADVVVACDGIHSALRRQYYQDEKLAFAGINTWRGVTKHKPILTGKSYMRVGSIKTGKMVIYPIVDNIDGQGMQLINWMAEIEGNSRDMNDWNTGGKVDDFISIFKDWQFDWLDVPALIRNADQVPHGGQRPGGAVDLWPRDVDGRCRPPHVPTRLQRLGASIDRRAHFSARVGHAN